MSLIATQSQVSDPWMDAYDAVVAPPAADSDPWMAAYDAAVGGVSVPTNTPGTVPAGFPGQAQTIPVQQDQQPTAVGPGGDIVRGLQRGVGVGISQMGGAVEAAGGFLQNPDTFGPMVGYSPVGLAARLPGGAAAGRALTDMGADITRMGNEDTAQFPQTTTMAGNIAESAPALAGMIGAGVLTGGAGGIAMAAAQGGGGQYNAAKDRILKMGGTREQAQQVALAEAGPAALVTAATSAIPLGRYLQRFSPALLSKAGATLSKNVLFRLAGYAAAEGSQEAAEQVGQMVLQRIAEDDPAAFKDWQAQIGQAALGGAVLGGAAGGVADVAGRMAGGIPNAFPDAQPAEAAPGSASDRGTPAAADAVVPPAAVGVPGADRGGAGQPVGVVPAAVDMFGPDATEAEVQAWFDRQAESESQTTPPRSEPVSELAVAGPSTPESVSALAVDEARPAEPASRLQEQRFAPAEPQTGLVEGSSSPDSTPVPTTAQELRAEARRLGVKETGSLRAVRERVRETRDRLATQAPSETRPQQETGQREVQPSRGVGQQSEPPGKTTSTDPEQPSVSFQGNGPLATVPTPPAGREANTRQALVSRFKPGNPFAERAAIARERYNSLSAPSARDAAMAQSFPLGAGFGRKGDARRIDATINKAVASQKALADAKWYESNAAAFDRGEINAQGRAISKESQERSIKREKYQETRAERVAKAKELRGDKERWQVPADVWADSTNNLGGGARALILSEHQEVVERAIRAGKPVPANVLADYPSLAARVSGGESASVPASAPAEKVANPKTLAAAQSPEGARPQSKSGGRKARETASTDTPRPASPGVERGSTSGEGSKQPWQMTSREYGDAGSKEPNSYANSGRWDADRQARREAGKRFSLTYAAAVSHENAVKSAIASGKAVPPEVLAEYPNLTKPTPKSNPRRRGAVVNPIDETLDLIKRAGVRNAAKRTRDLAKIEQRGADKARTEAELLQRGKDSAELTAKVYANQLKEAAGRARSMGQITERAQTVADRRLARIESDLADARTAMDGMKAKLRQTVIENRNAKDLREIMQARVAEIAKDYLPPDLQGKMLVPVRDAKNAADVFKAIFRVEDILLDRAAKNTVRVFNAVSAKSMLAKLTKDPAQGTDRPGKAAGIVAAAQLDVEALKNATTQDARRTALDALTEKVNQLREIHHEQKYENKLRIKGEWVDRKRILDRLSAAIALDNKKPRARDARDPTRIDQSVASKLGEWGRKLYTPETMFMRIDGDFDTGDIATETAYRAIDKAEDMRDAEHQRFYAASDTLARQLGFDGVADVMNQLGGKVGTASEDRVNVKPVLPGGVGEAGALSVGQVLNLYAHSQDATTGDLIRRGVQWRFEGSPDVFDVTHDDIGKLLGLIDPRLLLFHDGVNMMKNAHFPAIQEAQWIVKGIQAPEVRNHWNRPRDTSAMRVSGEDIPRGVPRLESSGPLIARKESVGVPIILENYADALVRQMDWTFRVKHLMVPIWAARRVMQDPAIHKAIETRYGKQMNRDIANYFDRASGLVDHRNVLDRYAGLYSGARTALNWGSWLKQPSSYFLMLPDMGVAEWAKGIPAMFDPRVQANMVGASVKAESRFGQDPGSLYAGLLGGTPYKASPMVAARAAKRSASAALSDVAGTPGAVVAGYKEKGLSGAARAGVGNLGRSVGNAHDILAKAIPAVTQRITVANWMDGAPARGAFKAMGGAGMSPESLERFETAIARALNSGRVTQDAVVIQDIKAGGLGAVTAFKSDLTKKLNVLIRNAHRPTGRKAAAVAGVLGSMVFAAGITAMTRAALRSAAGDDEKDDSPFWEDLIDQSADTLAPYLGSNFTRGWRSFKRGYRGNILSIPVLGNLEQMAYSTFGIVDNTMKSLDGDAEKADKAFWSLYDLLSGYAKSQGVPMTLIDQAARVVEKRTAE